ncbi:MAG: hypothetical protein Q9207_006532 [Kuettlingeria erythrocarpa]
MAEANVLPVPTDGNLSLDVDVKSVKGTRKLSFTTVEATPPETPPNDGNIPESPSKSSSQGILLQSTTLLEEEADHAPAVSADTQTKEAEPQETLPLSTNQTQEETKPEAVSAPPGSNGVHSKVTPQDLPPVATKQLDNITPYSAVPASTDGYQDTVVAPPKLTAVPQAAQSLSPATRLKYKLQHTTDLIVCPGVYDGLSARIAQAAGFETLYMTGAGSTASMLGMADLGIASRTDMVRNADMISNLDPHHHEVIADMDTGYGGPVTIAQTVNQYIRANVAAFHIEDQVLTKRCGHLSGKKVVTNEVYLSRIRAARAAIDHAQADIQLIARTDANQQLGYDECIVRLKAARECGADVGLLEGFRSHEEAARAVKDLAPWPLLLNIVENGHSPLITVDQAQEMGFRIMIFSFAGLAPAYMAMTAAYEKLRREGITGIQGTGVGPKVLFDVCGLKDAVAVDTNAGGEDYKSLA